MNHRVVGAAKVFMFKLLLIAVWIFLGTLFSFTLVANPIKKAFVGGLDTEKFYICQNKILKHCEEPTLECIDKKTNKLLGCQQFISLIKATKSFPITVENYHNIEVVQGLVISHKKTLYNYFMIGKPGEIVLPSDTLSLARAPGFYNLKKRYPNAKLTNVILGFPEAVFLTRNIQKLLIYQEIIDPALGHSVGYAKVLYSFTTGGYYQGCAIMRIMIK